VAARRGTVEVAAWPGTSQRTNDPLHAMQFRPAPPPQVNGPRPVQQSCLSDRDCPLHTARDRCLWHAGGTTGENDDAGTWRQQFLLGQWVRLVSGDYRLVGKGRRPAAGGGWESPTPPPGPSRLASLSSGDDRNRRLRCASTSPIAFCYRAALLPRARPIGAFGRSLAGEPRSDAAFRRAARDCAAPAQGHRRHPFYARRLGQRARALGGLARTRRGDCATPKGVDAPNHDARC
jgi:hypothetical protein